MRAVIKKIWQIEAHAQVLVIILVFALMVFFCYYFMSDIERRHLLNNVNNVMSTIQTYIETDLLEPETTLGVIAENIKHMLLHGSTEDYIRHYLIQTYEYLISDERLMSYVSAVYGYFYAFDGLFMTGTDWVPPDDYDPQIRPWYSVAIEASGKVGVTEPYINASNGNTILTFSRIIYDLEDRRLAIVCFDITINRLLEYVVNTHVTEESYGILFDGLFYVLAHPNPVFLGRHISQMNNGTEIQRDLSMGIEISERPAVDYNGAASVLFIRQLNNGWYMAIMAYEKNYYHSVNNILFILVILGTVFATVLSAILLSMLYEKKEAEERTQLMLDATPLCTSIWNRSYKIIDCNKETINLFGLSNKKEYLEGFYNLSPEYQPDGKLSSEKAQDFIKKAFEENYCRFEWMHRNLSGELIPCEIVLVRVKYKKEMMVCGYSRDLRKIKAMMAKMREADECTQVLFDTTPLSCFMMDNKLNVLECNQEIVRLFGLSDKKEYINNVFNFFPEVQPFGRPSKDFFIKNIDEAFEDGHCHFEMMHQKLTGEPLPTEVTLVRVKFRGEYAVAGYIRDLRELKNMIAEMHRAEVAEESSKAKSDFLAKMSHEIRTPMNAILGITEIQLRDQSLPLLTKEALERIYNSGDLLLGIINDILDLSKIESGRFELSYTQYDIASLIHDTVKLNIIRYESKPIDFKLIVSENVPSLLIGDELRIKQILNNLLSNSFKYTQEGQIELTLSTEPQKDSSGVNLIFRVSDTGQGMTEEQVSKLGDKFSRFNLEANRKTEGAGLGMHITLNLIDLMGGDVAVESTPGMGSVFTVRLPQECANPDPIGMEVADNLMKLNLHNTIKTRNAQITQEFMPYGRVLVVDDVETNLFVAQGLLAPYGISINTASSGFEAIDKIRDGIEYDIIFMDHMMPRMDGIEATKTIRSLGYKRPIVALTANAIAGQAEVFLKNGFDGFISKPIDTRQLNSILNRLIRDKQTPEVLEEARRQRNILYAAGGHNLAVEPQLAEFFVRDAKKAITILNAIYKNKLQRDDDVTAFIINAHALKSALANVGESELSDKASELEQAGREQNTDFILSSLPGFLESLQQVVEKLEPPEEDGNTAENADYGFLQEKLLDIQTACSFFDKKTAKTALAELKQKQWSRSIREQLSAISEHLLHSEFDEAAALTREIHLF